MQNEGMEHTDANMANALPITSGFGDSNKKPGHGNEIMELVGDKTHKQHRAYWKTR